MSFEIIETVQAMQSVAKAYGQKKVAFVPTMGALHEGHLSLVRQAQRDSDIVIVSIFVNPTQFNNPNDLSSYPQRISEDIEQLKSCGVNYVFLPKADAIYPNGYHYRVQEDQWSEGLCGGTRPGHFDGVLTVLIKLFNIVKPQRVYMGLKDYQQWKLVRGMCEDFFMDIDVVGVPTVRTAEGLALSSRNLNLSPEQVQLATKFASVIKQRKSLDLIQQELEGMGLKVDYLEERWGRRFAAVFVGPVRLIDNIEIPSFGEIHV